MQRVRSSFEVLQEIDIDWPGQWVLDAGSGRGSLCRHLAGLGARAIGLEYAAAPLADLAASATDSAMFVQGDARAIPLPAGTVDVLIFDHSFHHLPVAGMQFSLHEARRVLKPNGRLLVLEPGIVPGPSLANMIDDETEVCAAAYRTLQHSEPFGLAAEIERHYLRETIYRDPDDLFERWIIVDPRRREKIQTMEAQLRARFYTEGRAINGGYSFEAPVRLNTFRRAA